MAFVWERLATMASPPLHMSPALLRVTAFGAFGAQHEDRCAPSSQGKTIC